MDVWFCLFCHFQTIFNRRWPRSNNLLYPLGWRYRVMDSESPLDRTRQKRGCINEIDLNIDSVQMSDFCSYRGHTLTARLSWLLYFAFLLDFGLDIREITFYVDRSHAFFGCTLGTKIWGKTTTGTCGSFNSIGPGMNKLDKIVDQHTKISLQSGVKCSHLWSQ